MNIGMENTSSNQQVTQTPQPKRNKLSGLLLLLLVGVLVACSVLAYKLNKMSRQVTELRKLTVQLGSEEFDTVAKAVGMNKENWKTYENSEYGFMIKYPAEWMDVTPDELVEEGNNEFVLETHNKEVVVGKVMDTNADFASNSPSIKSFNLSTEDRFVVLSYLTCLEPECSDGEKDLKLFEDVAATYSLIK
jgi:hypothetical protein